jgi:glutathione S-transferase
MDLYFSPMACSLASRIALYDAGGEARFIEVDPATKRTLDGADYRAIYVLGLVPLLRLDDGSLLSENAAILQYIAGRYPSAKLAPSDDIGRARAAMAVLHRHGVEQRVLCPAVRSKGAGGYAAAYLEEI